MIKCGKCGEKHQSVAEVKACYARKLVPVQAQHSASYDQEQWDRSLTLDSGVSQPMFPDTWNDSLRSNGGYRLTLDDMRDAAMERERIAEEQANMEPATELRRNDWNAWGSADRERAQFIRGNKQTPSPRVLTGFTRVEAGYYALVQDDVTKFYRVRLGKEGTRWAGWIFVDAQASDEFWPIKNREHKESILRAIAENPTEAGARYGREIGRCWKCHRTLTDETSRANGIGPDCASRL